MNRHNKFPSPLMLNCIIQLSTFTINILVYVCVREREKERERQTDRLTDRDRERACVCLFVSKGNKKRTANLQQNVFEKKIVIKFIIGYLFFRV